MSGSARLISWKRLLMEHDKRSTIIEGNESVKHDSPDVTFIRRTVLATCVISFSALVVLTFLDNSGILEYPRLLRTHLNTVLLIGWCAICFGLVYVNWTNYFWRRDTEQKHSLFWPILSTIGFVVLAIYAIWLRN